MSPLLHHMFNVFYSIVNSPINYFIQNECLCRCGETMICLTYWTHRQTAALDSGEVAWSDLWITVSPALLYKGQRASGLELEESASDWTMTGKENVTIQVVKFRKHMVNNPVFLGFEHVTAHFGPIVFVSVRQRTQFAISCVCSCFHVLTVYSVRGLLFLVCDGGQEETTIVGRLKAESNDRSHSLSLSFTNTMHEPHWKISSSLLQPVLTKLQRWGHMGRTGQTDCC